MELRYLELRRVHAPLVLVSRGLDNFSQLTIPLLPLQKAHPASSASSLWRNNKPYRRDWPASFSAGAEVVVCASYDPSDELSGKEARGRLVFTFNAEATAEFARVIRATGGAEAPPWELGSLQLSLIGNSPLLHVLSLFRPSSPVEAGRFENESNGLNLLNDQFWPVFLAVLEELQRRTSVSEWAGERMPFGQPPTFLASGHPDFDPSAEYHFEAHLFAQGTEAEMATWRRDAVPGRQEVLDKPSRSGAAVRISWGTVLWEVSAPAPMLSEHDMIEEVLSTTLASDMCKVITFRDRLYAALLDDAQSGRASVPAEELRDLIYRDHALWQGLSQRGRSLSEFGRLYYRVAKGVYETDEHVESVRHLGNLVIHAAEGIEAESALQAEWRLQRIALVLSIVALGALIMDSWDFLQGVPNEPIFPDSARFRVGFVSALFLILTALALLLGSLFIGRRKARSMLK